MKISETVNNKMDKSDKTCIESGPEKLKSDKDDKIFNYSEAIELAGNGYYTIGLVVTLSWTLLAMLMDLFSFALVVKMCSCDFHLDLTQTSILVSVPFIGSVVMAYPWGYICDTQGRRKSLLIGLSISFLMSTLCAFAPNWIVLGILKLIGTCSCSCAQSACYTLLGESCAEKVKGTYMLFMTSIIHSGAGINYTLAYVVGNLIFSYDLGFLHFLPWRLMVLIFAIPLGISVLALYMFYESPKFLLNIGREEESLRILRNICRRNGGDVEKYPVQKLVLSEEGNLTLKDISLLQSLWEQTAPLFKPPLLQNTLLLYYLIFVIYSSNSSLNIWLPFLSKAFTAPVEGDQKQGLCNMISSITNSTSEPVPCSPTIDLPVVIGLCTYGICCTTLNILLAKLASRKKALMFGTLLISALFCLGITIPSNMTTFFFFGVISNSLCMGYISAYYVDLYPTSFRGMAACLGVMMSRLSSIIGINLMGPFILSNCSITFYGLSALIFSGVMMSYFLPPDRPKKV